MRAMSIQKKIMLTLLYFTVAFAFSAYFLIPLWQTFVGAFSTLPDVLSGEFRLLPRTFSWNLPRLIEIQLYPNIWVMFTNTLILSTATIPTLFFSALAAYGLARFNGPGQGLVFGLILSSLMLPFAVTMVPRFLLFSNFGWINTYWPFFIPTIGGNAMVIFLLRQFMRNVPKELDDAGKVDGASHWRLFWSIMLPVCMPALATTFIFIFVGTWNDFMGPLIYLNSNRLFPFALGIVTLRQASNRVTEWNAIMFAALMATVPLLAVFFTFQRHIIKGVVMSGIKG